MDSDGIDIEDLRARVGAGAMDAMDAFTQEFVDEAVPMVAGIIKASRVLLNQDVEPEQVLSTVMGMASSAVWAAIHA